MRWAQGLVLGCALWAATARAAPSDRGVHLVLRAGTNFPLDVGGGLGLELGPFQVSAEAGVLPNAYVNAANSALVASNLYDAQTAELLHDALKNSLVLRTHLGWRPFPRAGFFVQAGYGVGFLDASLTAIEVANAAKMTLPGDVDPQTRAALHTTVQLLDAQVGWRWVVAQRMEIRAALGGAHAFASKSKVQIDQVGSGQPYAAQISGEGARWVDRQVTTFGSTVELTLGVGFLAF